MYCLYWKHADEIVRTPSFVEALLTYLDCIDNRGLELWWEPADAVTTWIGGPA